MTTPLLRRAARLMPVLCALASFACSESEPPENTAVTSGAPGNLTPDRPSPSTGTLVAQATDYVHKTGIEGVTVTVTPANHAPLPYRLTNQEGKCTLQDVPIGPASVQFIHNGYRQRPTVEAAEVKRGQQTLVPTVLIAAAQTQEYYRKVGQQIVLDVRRSGSPGNAYRQQFERLRHMGLAPSSNVIVFQSMAKADSNVTKAEPRIQDYLHTSPDAADRLYERFARTLDDPAHPIPRPADAGVPNEVVTDIASHVLRERSQSGRNKTQFYEKFQAAWGPKAARDIQGR